jgi:hypothetical protein
MDELVYELFSTRWSGCLATATIPEMKDQLYKSIKSQMDGYWSGNTAYWIMVDGGFLIDAKTGAKKLTSLGQMFIEEMETVNCKS